MIRAERHIETEKEVCGEITVFLSLILTCICALMGGLFESARAAGSGWYMQMALNSSLDSLMSCYHREIWDKYRIFVLECADKERLAAEMEPQMETYLAAAPFYPVSGGKVQIEAMDAITGHNGDFFAKEVTDYMKVGVWTLESEESELPEMEKRMTEARAVHGIAEGYQENGRKVLRLEESIEAIGACLQKQEKHLEEMEAAVRQADGSSFFQSAESLEKELKQIPGLVAAYEKQADAVYQQLLCQLQAVFLLICIDRAAVNAFEAGLECRSRKSNILRKLFNGLMDGQFLCEKFCRASGTFHLMLIEVVCLLHIIPAFQAAQNVQQLQYFQPQIAGVRHRMRCVKL